MYIHICSTGRRRVIGFLILIGHFPPKSPVISGTFAENDLQLEVSSPLCSCQSMCVCVCVTWLIHICVCVCVIWLIHMCVCVCQTCLLIHACVCIRVAWLIEYRVRDSSDVFDIMQGNNNHLPMCVVINMKSSWRISHWNIEFVAHCVTYRDSIDVFDMMQGNYNHLPMCVVINRKSSWLVPHWNFEFVAHWVT